MFLLEPAFDKVMLPNTSEAVSYQVVSMNDFSFPGRKRTEWIVAADVPSPEAIKQTATKAAIDLQEKDHAQVVSIFLVRKPGDQDGLARMSYAVDGKGNSGEDNWKWNWLPLHESVR
ncbi:MAG: hypothetical protein JXK94_02175 [Deltaproteobacteria bacterium]|nr:hypothetical protein [Deltaproteobacteria bacterium]